MFISSLLLVAIIPISCRSSVLLSQSARQISKDLLNAARRDMEPSLRWAAVQIEALVPVEFANEDCSSSDSDSWSFSSDQSIIDGHPNDGRSSDIPDEIIIRNHNVRPEIVRALGALGKSVVKALKPGLSEAVIHLLKNHTSNPLTKDQLFSKEELTNFILELSDIWSSSLKSAVIEWSDSNLDNFLNFVKKVLSSIGKEILKRLGFAAGVMNTDRNNGMNSPRSYDLFDNIRSSSHQVAISSLTFLHGSGWMSKQLFKSLPDAPIEIEDDMNHPWDKDIWEMWE